MVSYFTFIATLIILAILVIILLLLQRGIIKNREEKIIKLSEKLIDTLRLATTDDLTGIYNRRHIIERLKEETERAIRYCHTIHILFIDVNNFKVANDKYGHDLGDKILKKIAKILRKYDICGRYGGDEFVVILPETEKSQAYIVAERISADVEKMAKELINEINIGVSIGISSYTGNKNSDITVENLLKKADEAMYKLKRAQKAGA